MGTPRGLERLIFFTDAVAAIAITLLILPLVDLVPEAKDSANVSEFLVDIRPQALSFLISFLVIARLWTSHHAVFEHVKAYSRPLMALSLFWSLTIVVLPLPTAMTAAFTTQPLVVGIYAGTMLLSSASLTAMAVLVHRSAALEDDDFPLSRKAVFGSAVSTVTFVLILLVGVLVPGVNYYAFLLLLVADPIGALLERRTSSVRG